MRVNVNLMLLKNVKVKRSCCHQISCKKKDLLLFEIYVILQLKI